MSAETVLTPPPPLRQGLQKRLRPLLLMALALLVMLKIVALSPATLEEAGAPRTVDIDELVLRESHTLAPGIPQGKVPDYTINKFNYFSTHAGAKEWNLLADEAYMFNTEKLLHARTVRANLYGEDGKITVVTGLEAKYLLNQSDLEVFGNVKTTFPDGFVVTSDYMRYRPKEKKIEIPISYPTEGQGNEENGEHIHFWSHGMEYLTAKGEILLPEAARMTVQQDKTTTLVRSDKALIHRHTNLVDFWMNEDRPSAQKFVELEQPTEYARGRTGKLVYGSGSNMVKQLTLFDDVFVQEFTMDPKTGARTISRYGTGGRGDFDSKRNLTILTIYPQVYQDEDTLTGDKITLHRDSDVVEVEHSNGFSLGNNDPDTKPSPEPVQSSHP